MGKLKVVYQSGYTLIEVLAVLIILGLIGLLAFPRFNGGEEKAYLNQISKLVQADLTTAREEAVCGKSEIGVAFFENGYLFEIGEIEIRRVFDKFQFHWDIPMEVTETTETTEIIESYDEVEADVESENLELRFKAESDIVETTIRWVTEHYEGNILIKPDGSVTWEYASK